MFVITVKSEQWIHHSILSYLVSYFDVHKMLSQILRISKLSIDSSKGAHWKLQVQDWNKNKYQEFTLVDPISLNASRMYILEFFLFLWLWFERAIWFIFLITHLWRDESFNLFLKMVLYGFLTACLSPSNVWAENQETLGWVSLQRVFVYSLL